jgi:hypothetical protein
MADLTLTDRMTAFKELVRVEDLGVPLPQARGSTPGGTT